MLSLIEISSEHRAAVAALGVHRMVGRNGMGDVSDADRVSFGRKILNLKYDEKLISFSGRVYTVPSRLSITWIWIYSRTDEGGMLLR